MRYKGKRVAKKSNFKLFKQGKRIAKDLEKNNFVYQILQLFSGKVKYLFSKVKENIDCNEINQNFLELSTPEELELDLAEIFMDEYLSDNVKVSVIKATSFDDINDIMLFLNEGNIVIVNYATLNAEMRKQFDRKLSIELMQIGTHLTHLSKSEIVCACRQVSVIDGISEKKEGKIYDLNGIMKR